MAYMNKALFCKARLKPTKMTGTKPTKCQTNVKYFIIDWQLFVNADLFLDSGPGTVGLSQVYEPSHLKRTLLYRCSMNTCVPGASPV